MLTFRAGLAATCMLLALAGGARAATFTTLYTFTGGADGIYPTSGLIEYGGNLYGTTIGTAGNFGAIFEINPSTGSFSNVYQFSGGDDGASPEGLININGTFFGTAGGGKRKNGVVYKIDPATGIETVVYYFGEKGEDGIGPNPLLLKSGSFLYGTTYESAHRGNGTLFKLKMATGTEKIMFRFGGSEGAPSSPDSGVVQVGHMLYGMSYSGGTNFDGTIYAADIATGAATVVHNFTGGADGASPSAGLTVVKGMIYGTTQFGGSSNFGTVFQVDPNTGAETVIHSFAGGADGQLPNAPLISVGGKLYGTTDEGGTGGYGVIFSLDPATGAEKILYSFTSGYLGSYGGASGLTYYGGAFYGVAEFGGPAQAGSIFKLQP